VEERGEEREESLALMQAKAGHGTIACVGPNKNVCEEK
jgi:hypothetical protein